MTRPTKHPQAAIWLTVALLASTVASASAATSTARVLRGRAPEIIAPTIEGKTFRLSALRGRVVVLDFLTPGCGECEIAAPLLERTAASLKNRRVSFVIVDLSGANPKQLRTYYRDELTLRHLTVIRDHKLEIARDYNAITLGTTIIIGRNGQITWTGSWHDSTSTLLKAVTPTL